MSDAAPSRRSGGREARRAARLHAHLERTPFLTRTLAPFEVLDEEGLSLIEHNADTILEEVGVVFRGDPEALDTLRDGDVPFLVGGAYAYARLTGIKRPTKDFDIFVRPRDVQRVLDVLTRAGFKTEIAFSHWLAKAHHGDKFIDVIYSSGNGVAEVDDEAINVLALPVFRDQLAVPQNYQLIAVLEPVPIGFDESHFGAIDTFFFAAREKFIGRALMLFNQVIPGGDFFVEPFDVLERIFGGQGLVQNRQERFERLKVLRSFCSQAAAGFAHLTVQNGCLRILPQPLQRQRFVELNDIGELAGVLSFIIIEPDQGRLHDVYAGNVFGYGKTVGILFG